MSPAKTNAERQKEWRKRTKEAANGTEVRGIFAPPAHHPPIKAEALKVARKLARRDAPKEKTP